MIQREREKQRMISGRFSSSNPHRLRVSRFTGRVCFFPLECLCVTFFLLHFLSERNGKGEDEWQMTKEEEWRLDRTFLLQWREMKKFCTWKKTEKWQLLKADTNSFVSNKDLLLCISWLLWPAKLSVFTDVGTQETLRCKSASGRCRGTFAGEAVPSLKIKGLVMLYLMPNTSDVREISFFFSCPAIINLDKLGLVDNNQKRL